MLQGRSELTYGFEISKQGEQHVGILRLCRGVKGEPLSLCFTWHSSRPIVLHRCLICADFCYRFTPGPSPGILFTLFPTITAPAYTRWLSRQRDWEPFLNCEFIASSTLCSSLASNLIPCNEAFLFRASYQLIAQSFQVLWGAPHGASWLFLPNHVAQNLQPNWHHLPVDFLQKCSDDLSIVSHKAEMNKHKKTIQHLLCIFVHFR